MPSPKLLVSKYYPALLCAAFFFSYGKCVKEIPSSIKSQTWRVVKLAERKPDGFHFVATGLALIRDGHAYIVTSSHISEVVHDAANLYADFPPPVNAHSASVLGTDPAADIAVLSTTAEVSGIVKEQIGTATQDQRIVIVGFDDEKYAEGAPRFQCGIVRHRGSWIDDKHLFVPSSGAAGGGDMLIAGPSCRKGGSGSPVFGRSGEILGIVKGSTDDGQCLAIGLQPGLKILEKFGIKAN